MISRRCEPCRPRTSLVCNSIRTATTFTMEAYGEIFQIQSGPLNYNSKKVMNVLKYIVCGEAPYVGKPYCCIVKYIINKSSLL